MKIKRLCANTFCLYTLFSRVDRFSLFNRHTDKLLAFHFRYFWLWIVALLCILDGGRNVHRTNEKFQEIEKQWDKTSLWIILRNKLQKITHNYFCFKFFSMSRFYCCTIFGRFNSSETICFAERFMQIHR